MDWVRRWGGIVVLGVIGVGLLVYGAWDQVKPREVKVEIVKEQGASDKVKVGGEIVVDVAGEIEKPGVYKLPSNSRVGDALVLAGGLSASADREWVAANLNLAQKLEDGEKVFIPGKFENPDSWITQSSGVLETKNQKININTAGMSELDSLEGIGEARAQTIIDNRPYSKTEELVTKAKIPSNVYDKIKDRVSVY